MLCLPHPLQMRLPRVRRKDESHRIADRLAQQPSNALLVVTDALELLLDETDVRDTVETRHFLYPPDAVYCQFGESAPETGWAWDATFELRVEGAYLFPSQADAMSLGADYCVRHGLTASTCNLLDIYAVIRGREADQSLRPRQVAHLRWAMQAPNEPVHAAIARTLGPDTDSVLPRPMAAALLTHLVKLMNYLAGQPEVEMIRPLDLSRYSPDASRTGEMPSLRVGPPFIDPVIERMDCIASPWMHWRRGRQWVTDDEAGQPYIHWQRPCIVREPAES